MALYLNFDCLTCKFTETVGFNFIPEITLDVAETVYFYLGYIGILVLFANDFSKKCESSNLAIFLCVSISHMLMNLLGKYHDRGYAKGKNINFKNFPTYYVDILFQEDLENQSPIPTNTMSAKCTTNLPIYRFCCNLAMTCWGFYELYNSTCVFEKYDGTYIYGIAWFATIIYLSNTMRWFVGICFLWPNCFYYKYYTK